MTNRMVRLNVAQAIGKGKFTFKNGDTYEGYFKDDKMHGKHEFSSNARRGLVQKSKWKRLRRNLGR